MAIVAGRDMKILFDNGEKQFEIDGMVAETTLRSSVDGAAHFDVTWITHDPPKIMSSGMPDKFYNDDGKAISVCSHCSQWTVMYLPCRFCGAPVP